MAIQVEIEKHPLLELAAICCHFPLLLGSDPSPSWLTDQLISDSPDHIRSEEGRSAIRRMLRHGGYRPAGRGKPASEYLMAAARRQSLSSINPAVDAINAASLHGGVPISVIDLALTTPAFRVGICGEGERYVFNSAGQEIDLEGLLCLHDAAGPCANGVKDAQRTKTGPQTEKVLGVLWGSVERGQDLQGTLVRLSDLMTRLGGHLEEVERCFKEGPGGEFSANGRASR